MRIIASAIALFLAVQVHAETLVDFAFKNAELKSMIEQYSKLTKTKFVIDPAVRGKADIITQNKVSPEEAFALLSSALAVNGYALSEQEGTYVVVTARNVQRSLIPVTDQLPALKPERMVAYIYTTKYMSASALNMSMRVLASKDGEIVAVGENKLMMTDWVSNIHRINQTLAMVDRADTKFDAKITNPGKKSKPTVTQ